MASHAVGRKPRGEGAGPSIALGELPSWADGLARPGRERTVGRAKKYERALAEPEASALRQRRNILDMLDTASSKENYERLKRVAEAGYDEVLKSVIFGTPEVVTERIQELREELGLTGLSLDMNPGGQIPQKLVSNSMRLMAEKVMPHFK